MCHHCVDGSAYCETCDITAFWADDGKCIKDCPAGYWAVNINSNGICVQDL